MESTDSQRLEHLLTVQDSQMTSLRELLKCRESELESLRDDFDYLQRDYLEQQAIIEKSQKDAEAFRDKESGMQLELHEKLNRQGASLLSLANKHLEGREREVELLTFELEKKDRVISGLRDEIRKREECLFTLRHEHEDLLRWKEKVQDGKVAAVLQHRADSEAKVALITSELHKQATEKQMLQGKFCQLEERLRIKDEDIRTFREGLLKHEEELSRQMRDLNALQFELNLKDVQLAELHKTALNREGELSMQLRRSKEQQEESLRVQSERHDRQLEEHTDEIRRLREYMEKLEANGRDLQLSVCQCEEECEKRDCQITSLQRQLAEAAARIETSDQSAEVNLLRNGEKELKRRLSEQVDVIEALQQDSDLLQKARMENVLKDKQCLELKAQIEKLTDKLSQLDVHRHTHSSPSLTPPSSSLRSREAVYSHPTITLDSPPFGRNPLPSPYRPAGRLMGLENHLGAERNPTESLEDAVKQDMSKDAGRRGRCFTQPIDMRGISDCWGYVAVLSDAVDVAMSKFLNGSRAPDMQPFSVRRLNSGLYELWGNTVNVKLINGQLMVQVNGGVMRIGDYIASEQYAANLRVDPKHFSSRRTAPHSLVVSQHRSDVGRSVDPFNHAVAIAPQGRLLFKHA